MKNFKAVNLKQSFPKLEEEILKFWEEEKIFEESLAIRKDSPEFNFYDGPPFATWTPHYGHILAGTIKDVIPRYQTMKWFRVDRKFGWDCHGLPIENIVEKKMWISGKDDIEKKIWVYEFNEECRANVFTYAHEWEKTVSRMGRWVDMKNDYKTMDTNFMESVWWVYKELYKKWLIYEGYRVVPYCPRCSTPLSNFEVNQWYKDKQDKTATVKFKVKWNENKYILAWTTTPWTLAANLWLAVWADIDYVELLDKKTKETYILAKERIWSYYKSEEDYIIAQEYKWKCLVWTKYEPIFGDFWAKQEIDDMPKWMQLWENVYSVVIGHHVTTESGTWIVHIAPAYWEDDYIIWQKHDLWFVSHIDDTGKTEHITDDKWMHVFDFNEKVIQNLKEKNQVIQINTIDHSYPHCWRCDSPLIYRAINAWYVAVEKIRDKMVANNEKINWTPDIIKHGRFWTWIENARDWNISRNRYWWSAIPVWQNKDKTEEVCIWSIQELYELNKEFWDITKVIFVRHGESEWNKNWYVDWRIDESWKNQAKLTEKWRIQAEEIKNLLKNEKIDVIYSSPFNRAINTIKPLADKLWIEIKEDLWLSEISFWNLNGKETILWTSIEKHYFENLDEKIWEIWDSINSIWERAENAFNRIINENKWKTIIISSHYFPIQKILHTIKWIQPSVKTFRDDKLRLSNKNLNNIYSINYIYTNTKKAVDIHKHFVDDLFILNKNNFKAKKVLWIHGFLRNENVIDFLRWTKNNLEKEWIIFDCPDFEKWENILYKNWEEKLDTINLKNYDTVVTHSMWWRVAMEYIIENKIKLERLVLVSATKNWSWRKEITEFYSKMKHNVSEIQKYVKEIIIIISKDDTVIRIDWARDLAAELNANLIEVNWFGHFNVTENKLIETITKYWAPLKRIPEVLDCWFESWSMPYASKHYPFENNEDFKFPADFIAEWIDQTRGWFYTLLILGTALFDNTPFLNVIVNGTVLAEDWHKMSKSKKNYPDPQLIFDKYWADAMRFYLMNSPVVEAQDFRFAESWVEEVVKKVILPLWNTYYFFTTYANIDNFEAKWIKTSNNNLDKWLISELNELTKEVTEWFDSYKLNLATKPIVKFMDNLTNWYIRRSRKRFWKSENDWDKMEAYETLYYVLVEITKIIAPFMPFIWEYLFKELTWKKSVHLCDFPKYNEKLINIKLNEDTDKVQKIITLWLAFRANNKIRVRQPLQSITITEKLDNYYTEIIKEELNVKEVLVVDWNSLAKQVCKPNWRTIWPKFGANVKFIMSEAKAWNFETLENWNIKVWEFELETWDFELVFETWNSNIKIESWFWMVISMDDEITPELKLEWFARDIVRHIQEARKEADFNVEDRIEISLSWVSEVLEKYGKYIETETLSKINNSITNPNLEKDIEIEDLKINLKLKK